MARGNLKGVAAGRFRERVTLLAPTRRESAYGKSTAIDYTAVVTVWADVVAAAGREVWVGDQPTAVQVYDVTIRRRSDVNESWRIAWRSETLEINAIASEGARDPVLRLTCRAIKAVD